MIRQKNKSSYLVPSIEDFIFMAIFLHVSLYAGKGLLIDGDTGYHIRAGEYILNTLSIPRYDMFSFISPPIPWIAHEWLSEIIMALIHRSFGLTGIVIFFAFLISLASYLLFKLSLANSKNILITICVVLFAICTSQVHWLARPHIFSLILMIIWYQILDANQHNATGHLYLLPFVMIVWVNLHGGFMGGFILLGVYLFGNLASYLYHADRERKTDLKKLQALALTTVICIAVTGINPYGYQILLFPFQLSSAKEIMDSVSEFMPPNFHENNVRLFEFLVFSLIITLAFSKFKLNAIEVSLITLFLYMSLYSARYIPLFAIIATPILSRQLNLILEHSNGSIAELIKKSSSNVSAINDSAVGYIWPAASIILTMSLVASGKIEYSFDKKIKPIAAIEFIANEKISGNMFNNDEFGDCLIYCAYPKYKVFFDGRLDMYGVSRVKEYHKITNFDQGWEDILDKYGISWIFNDADSALSRHLLLHRDWKLIYADKVANIFVKNIPEYQHLIKKYPSIKPVVKKDRESAAR